MSEGSPLQAESFASWVPGNHGQPGQRGLPPRAAPDGEATPQWGPDALARELEEVSQFAEETGPAGSSDAAGQQGRGRGWGEGEWGEGRGAGGEEEARKASPPLLSIPQRLASAFVRGPGTASALPLNGLPSLSTDPPPAQSPPTAPPTNQCPSTCPS